MDIKSRLLEFVNYIGYNDARFEREVGLANGFLKKTNANMRRSSVRMILNKFPQLSEEWLVNGNGDMLKQAQTVGNSINGNDNARVSNSFNKNDSTVPIMRLLMEQSKIFSKSQEQLSKSQDQLSAALEQIAHLTALLENGGLK